MKIRRSELMRIWLFIHLFGLFPALLAAQSVQVLPDVLDAGVIEEAGSLNTFVVVKNLSGQAQYLLRANSTKLTDVYVSRKRLEPGDTLHLRLHHRPQVAGRFKEELELYISGEELPLRFNFKGEIRKVLKDELQACVSFSPKEAGGSGVMAPVPTPVTHVPMPGGPVGEELDPEKFLPVNLILLIDVSGSMKESDKLPVLKASMRQLFKVMRPGDRVSILTYATGVQVLAEGLHGNERTKLESITDSLNAGGLTSGSQGLKQAYEMAERMYIPGGNNQVILATDGNFTVRVAERKMISGKADDLQAPLKLSVLAYGDQPEHHKRLKALTELGKGNFIYVRNARGTDMTLLEEIKKQSAIR